jgi:hypothetical protein
MSDPAPTRLHMEIETLGLEGQTAATVQRRFLSDGRPFGNWPLSHNGNEGSAEASLGAIPLSVPRGHCSH